MMDIWLPLVSHFMIFQLCPIIKQMLTVSSLFRNMYMTDIWLPLVDHFMIFQLCPIIKQMLTVSCLFWNTVFILLSISDTVVNTIPDFFTTHDPLKHGGTVDLLVVCF